MIVLQALAASFLATAVFVAVTTLAGRAFGLMPEVIAAGAGPAPLTFKIRGATVRLGILVFAGYVRFKENSRGEDKRLDLSAENPRSAMERLPLWKQIVFGLSGAAALLLAAVLLMGPDALTLAFATVKTLALFALSPLGNDTVIRDAFDGLAARPSAARIGAVFAVYGGINLAPLALLPAGSVVMAILGRVVGIFYDRGIGRAYFLASLLLIGWIVVMLGIQLFVLVKQTGFFPG